MERDALTDELMASDAFVALIMKGDELRVVGSAHLSQDEVSVMLYAALQGALSTVEEAPHASQLH